MMNGENKIIFWIEDTQHDILKKVYTRTRRHSLFSYHWRRKENPNKYGDAKQVLMKHSKTFEQTTEASKIRLRKKLAKNELCNITRNHEEWITNLKLLRG